MTEVGIIHTTGEAAKTVAAHSAPKPITLFGSSFCPFVQRAWITLESLQIPYQYVEIDPYAKPKELLEVNPRGLVPGLRIDGPEDHVGLKEGQWIGLGESVVIMDFLEELGEKGQTGGKSLLPDRTDIYNRALERLHADYVNRTIIPSFYRFLQAQEPDKQVSEGKEFLSNLLHLLSLFRSASAKASSGGSESSASSVRPPKGLFYTSNPTADDLSWADTMVAPWIVRIDKVLKYYRGFDLSTLKSEDGKAGEVEALRDYVKKVEENGLVKKTTSEAELYVELYKRYAENRPDTSMVANAINSGRGLP